MDSDNIDKALGVIEQLPFKTPAQELVNSGQVKPVVKKGKISVKKGDKNWKGKIIPWIQKMKSTMSKDEIVNTLGQGYIITPNLKKHIENECNN